jgi:hypothetical protein
MMRQSRCSGATACRPSSVGSPQPAVKRKKDGAISRQTDARQPWRACWERGGRLFCTSLASNISFGFNLSSQPALAHTRLAWRMHSPRHHDG